VVRRRTRTACWPLDLSELRVTPALTRFHTATIIAAVFELVGAMVLGRVSTSTIAGGIANFDMFKAQPMSTCTLMQPPSLLARP
jgi:phosphate/sulfate permease